MDANSQINLRAINGIVAVAILLALGTVVLAALGKTTPEWVGNAVIGITGGVIGYLSRDPKHAPAVGSSENTLLVNQTTKDEAP